MQKKSTEVIKIRGARQHNLKNINLEIPKNQLVVFTGVSGSGKSSLAMDTIYAEGQRRYVESLSSYARQFLGVLDKPDVDSIEGLSPSIAIDQKTVSRNPRSTVGTITEIYDYLRLLYARVGHQKCIKCGRVISRQSSQQILEAILNLVCTQKDYKSERGVRFMLLAPIVKDRKGEFTELLENVKKQAILRARVDGKVIDLREKINLLKTNKHSIEAILSRNILNEKKVRSDDYKNFRSNLFQTIESGLRLGDGYVVLTVVKDTSFEFPENPTNFEDHLFSESFACPTCNISYKELEPRSFSFNSPHGACSACSGLGTELNVDINLVLKKELSVLEGGIVPWSGIFESTGWMRKVLESVAEKHNFSLTNPLRNLHKEALDIILYGFDDTTKFKVGGYNAKYEGVVPNLLRRHKETSSDYVRSEIEKYMVKDPCKLCQGTRLKDEVLSVEVGGKNIWEVSNLSIENFKLWSDSLCQSEDVLSVNENTIAFPIVKEISSRLQFLLDVGLAYLTIARSTAELSGGEAQRIRLASQIGSGLSGVLYVLDEPSIGLHQRDQGKLINTLKKLRDLGNTVIVVEHDEETMLESDYLVDFGPGAGEFGGEIVAQGTPQEIIQNEKSLTGLYLGGRRKVGDSYKIDLSKNAQDSSIAVLPLAREKNLVVRGATGRNLKNIDFSVPFGKLVSVVGVSGSGKSTLVMDTLLRGLRQHFGLKNEERPEPFKSLENIEYIDKVISIDQTPIGRTPKSNPATYTKTFDHVRELFSLTQEARIRGYGPGRFSFNVKGGRCEHCQGEGKLKIEMQFMPDVYINCDVCNGRRYNHDALEIHFKGKNISDVLEMTVDEALKFFENMPSITRKLETISNVGLGYIKLGQPAPTLSGGEAQRVKLATELSKRASGRTLYILDEPTTGLHFADLEKLISILKLLVARGNTVLVIEHNLDVIVNSDWVVELGPEGGDKGGFLVFNGPLGELSSQEKSYTAQALRKSLKHKQL